MLANVLIGKYSYLYVVRSSESDIIFRIKQSGRYLLFLIFKYFVLHYQPCIQSIYETQSTPICRDLFLYHFSPDLPEHHHVRVLKVNAQSQADSSQVLQGFQD